MFEILKTSPNVILYILWKHNAYEKLVAIEFCNDNNLPNVAEEETCYKTSKSQAFIDLLQAKSGQKFFQSRLLLSVPDQYPILYESTIVKGNNVAVKIMKNVFFVE